MHVSRDSHGHLRVVSKPKDKGAHGRSKPTGSSFDRPTPGRHPLPPSENFGGPGRGTHRPPSHDIRLPDRTRKPPTNSARDPWGLNTPGSDRRPPTWDPPRGIIPPPKPSNSARPAHRDRIPRFDEKNGIRRRSKDLYEEASWDVSPNTGTEYPCTQGDLDACGGNFRHASIRRGLAEVRAIWFSQPNTGPKVGIKQAALDIFQHNSRGRMQSAMEDEAIERLCIMIENACRGSWGPDVVIKCFCDLDLVFFRGKLRGHVCVTWAGGSEFEPATYGHTAPLGHGKALIQLNARFIFLESGHWHERPLNQTLATLLHEMW